MRTPILPFLALVAALAACLAVPTARAAERRPAHADPAPAAFPSLISCVRFDEDPVFCGERVPLEIPAVRERLEKRMLVMLWQRAQIILYAKRAGRFFPYIEQRLEQRGMPDDLKYIAVIESALRPHVGSHKGAVGYWQFIRPTALKYGLRVDGNIDERRNIFTSTEAALDYLSVLYGEFGSWPVACGAYNMGENGMRKRIRTQGLDDYWRLYLPRETMDYVFKAIAAKLILSEPEKYGFHFIEEDIYDPPEFDRVTVTLKRDTPVADIAAAADTYFKAIKDLNTQILGNDLVRGTHTLLVPKGAGENFLARLTGADRPAPKPRAEPQPAAGAEPVAAFEPDPSRSELRIYVVRKGDNVHAIARRLGVTVDAVLQPNGLREDSVIQPGQRLLVVY